ncbi:hypothetical protein J6590_011391 [Homalodisca vitripennis]|nr:hypothetical protein J6590_011391 [Homalodisca vitripennis]
MDRKLAIVCLYRRLLFSSPCAGPLWLQRVFQSLFKLYGVLYWACCCSSLPGGANTSEREPREQILFKSAIMRAATRAIRTMTGSGEGAPVSTPSTPSHKSPRWPLSGHLGPQLRCFDRPMKLIPLRELRTIVGLAGSFHPPSKYPSSVLRPLKLHLATDRRSANRALQCHRTLYFHLDLQIQ